MNLAWRIYRRLAQAFPHEFKLAYGTDCAVICVTPGRGLIKSPGFVGWHPFDGTRHGADDNVYSSKWALRFRELPAAANAQNLVMLQQSVEGDTPALAGCSYS